LPSKTRRFKKKESPRKSWKGKEDDKPSLRVQENPEVVKGETAKTTSKNDEESRRRKASG